MKYTNPNNSTAQPVTSDLTIMDAVRAIQQAPKFAKNNFALDIAFKAARGYHSAAQSYWLYKFAEETRVTVATAAPIESANVLPLTAIKNLLTTAAAHLKKPEIMLTIDSTRARVFLGENGSVIVYNPDAISGRMIAKIESNGTLTVANRIAGTEFASTLTSTLEKFAADPAKVAGEMGRLTGKCVFCNLQLTDKRSTEVGYGPVCAKHFGLAWG